MAISDNYSPLKEIGNGVTTEFSDNWPPLANDFLDVKLENVSTGAQVDQSEGTDYTVTSLTASGFTVDFTTAPPATEYVVIGRSVTQEQQVPFKTSKGFQGVVHETALDKLTAMIQEQQDAVNRSLKFQLGSVSSGLIMPELSGNANKVVAINSAGTAYEYLTLASGSSFVNTFDDEAFNGDGSTVAFSLSFTPAGANTVMVWVDGVRQRPGVDYTYGSGIITFTTAPETGINNIVVLNLTADVAASVPTDGSVSTNKLADSAVTTPKIADGAVTSDKILDGTIQQTDLNFQVSNPNIIINGNTIVAQRGTSFVSPSSGDYTIDRFSWGRAGTHQVTIAQDNGSSQPVGSESNLKMTVTTAEASLASGSFGMFGYIVEGLDLRQFSFGRSDAKEMTLSFWVRSAKAGKHYVAFRNAGSDRSYPAGYTVDVANTWEYKTITLTADTTGTWATDEADQGLKINFVVGAGSTLQGTADTWQAGNFFAASDQVNVLDTISNTFHITSIKLELGSVATPFHAEPYAVTFDKCRRYYERLFGDNGDNFMDGYADSTSRMRGHLSWYPKAKQVTVTFSSQTGFEVLKPGASVTNSTAVSLTNQNGNHNGGDLIIDSAGTPFTNGLGGNFRFNGSGQYIELDAEL